MFDVNLQKLEAFKAREGHCKVPNKYDPDKKLANWVGQVRREHNYLNRGEKSEYLTVDRLRKLATVGFVFRGRPMDVPWEVNFDKLKAYREEHEGRDPRTSHPELGSWVKNQRHYYNNKTDGKAKHCLSDEREEKLRNVGFVFRAGPRPSAEALAAAREGAKKTWDDRLQEFVRWKERHGHPYVPTVTDDEDKQLGRWVAKQRMAYRAFQDVGGGGGESSNKYKNSKYGVLTAERALKLANAGFAFDASHIYKTPKNEAAGGDVAVQADAAADDDYQNNDEDGSVVYDHEEDVSMLPGWSSYER
mmetsp:Transcript_36196/g.59030  ORF Transcript_36196/g.59030 Transcript_36196/m.59030 type:complete len:304 (+) Transcript_36196:338-1249(+)